MPTNTTTIPGDRRLHAFKGVGTLRLAGWTSRAATAEAAGLSWQITYRGIWRPVIQAADAAGTIVGEFKGRTLHRGGVLRWSDRELTLRPHSFWRERYVLAEDNRKLATIEGEGWGARPVNVTVDDAAEIEPGPLLFAAVTVQVVGLSAPVQWR